MSDFRVGIIGGSGLGDALGAQTKGQTHNVDTPFGATSGPITTTHTDGVDIAFLSRHGPGHTIGPSWVPFRANIFAMKKLGVTHVIASGATGSLKEDVHPGDLMIPDQVIDKTFRRAGTFFDQGVVAHVEFSQPFCEPLRQVLIGLADRVKANVHDKGTYVCMEGPQFSTVAESKMHRLWGGDLIGMTCMPEAKLAREAEMCYALVALPTDYDCWRPHEPGMTKQALLAEIIGNMNKATENAIELIRAAVAHLGKNPPGDCECRKALELAIWSDKSKVDRAAVERLRPIVGRYFESP
ncbi:MAG: S-methyl-5'-thioadenosine phosphorylase [Phycisphaerae bacterium]|nr:S-methyl-5'-thioadenosine phosphorylase [Phycisphaerae bacterium]